MQRPYRNKITGCVYRLVTEHGRKYLILQGTKDRMEVTKADLQKNYWELNPHGMTYSEALEAMFKGKVVQRVGSNRMVAYFPAVEINDTGNHRPHERDLVEDPMLQHSGLRALGFTCPAQVEPYFVTVRRGGWGHKTYYTLGWTPTAADMVATDWMVAGPEPSAEHKDDPFPFIRKVDTYMDTTAPELGDRVRCPTAGGSEYVVQRIRERDLDLLHGDAGAPGSIATSGGTGTLILVSRHPSPETLGGPLVMYYIGGQSPGVGDVVERIQDRTHWSVSGVDSVGNSGVIQLFRQGPYPFSMNVLASQCRLLSRHPIPSADLDRA